MAHEAKKCVTCGVLVLVLGKVEQMEHWLTPTHQERSLEEFRGWGQAEKKHAVILLFSVPVELKNLMEDLQKEFVHFNQLTNLFQIPWSKKGEVVLQFKECSLLDDIFWNSDGKIFKDLFWAYNVDAVLRLSELPGWKWNLLLEPSEPSAPTATAKAWESAPKASTSTSTSSSSSIQHSDPRLKVIQTETDRGAASSSGMTHDQIGRLPDRMAFKVLNKLCSYWEWQPPIYEVKGFETNMVIDTLTVNGKTYQKKNAKSRSYFPRRDELAKRCLQELKAIPSQKILMDCDDYVKKLQKLAAAKQWKIPHFKLYQREPVSSVGDTYTCLVEQNGKVFKSPFAAPVRDEAENLAAFHCLQKLKRLQGPPPTLEPLTRSTKEPVKQSNSVQEKAHVLATKKSQHVSDPRTQHHTLSFNCMTVPEIQAMDGNLAILMLRKLCSLRNWAPPIYEGRETKQGLIIFDVRVNGTLYGNLESLRLRHPWRNCLQQRIITTKSCLMQLSDVPRNETLLSCDDEVTKLKKFVEWKKWQLPIYRESCTPPPGSLHCISVTVNEMEYISVFGGFTREEGENFAAFYCLQELKELERQNDFVSYPLPPHTPRPPPFSPWEVTPQSLPLPLNFAPQTFPPPLMMLNFNFGANPFQQQQPYFPMVAPAPLPGFIGPRNNFRWNQQHATAPRQAPGPNPTRPLRPPVPSQQPRLPTPIPKPVPKNQSVSSSNLQVIEIETPGKSRKNKNDDNEVAVVDETKKPEEVYLSDDSDIEEVIVVNIVKPEASAGGILNVKTERSETPWETTYLPSDYVARWENPVEILGQICLVCDWDAPVFELEVSGGQGEEARYSFKLTVNRCHYQNERVERTEEKAKEKVTRLCLQQLCHLGQIPHPSIFWNIPLDPVQRLANLAECRLGEDKKHQPEYVITHDLEDEKYSSEVIYSTVHLKYPGSVSYPSEDEAKRAAALFCLRGLSKSRPGFNWTFAHGSTTAKARDRLPNVLSSVFTPGGNRNQMQKLVIEEMSGIMRKRDCDNLVVKVHVPKLKFHFLAQLPQVRELTLSCFSSCAHLEELEIHVLVRCTGTIEPAQLENSILSAEGNRSFPNVGAIRRPEENQSEPARKRRRISKSTCRFLLPQAVPIGFTLHTDRERTSELEMQQFVEYIATFDPRVNPFIALVRHWAKVNNLRFSPSLDSHQQGANSEDATSVIPDFALLDWLVICFLARLKIVPAPREILQLPKQKGQPRSVTFFNIDEEHVGSWRTTIPNAAAPPADHNIDVLSPEIVTLAQKFFHYYGESLSEGSWILNTRDAELIFTLDFLKGSFITDLTPDDMKNIREMKVTNGKKLIDSKCKLIVLHPTLNSNWRIVLDAEAEMTSKSNAQHIFTAMQTAAVKLKRIVQHLQKESEPDTAEDSLPDFNF